MAGSFGYEKEHYDLSLQNGEMSLFPAVREALPATEIVASGLSCRQQILHATGREARHFAEVLAGLLLG
jgi:Fe-S oxidoreductase